MKHNLILQSLSITAMQSLDMSVTDTLTRDMNIAGQNKSVQSKNQL